MRANLLNKADENGATPLMFAAQNGWRDVVEMMVNDGADVRAKDKNGLTARALAKSAGYGDLAVYLQGVEQQQ
jgi:ankyrin repeat protein